MILLIFLLLASHPLFAIGTQVVVSQGSFSTYNESATERLRTAVMSSNLSAVIESLEGGADPNARDEHGYTLLFNALLSRDQNILTALLEHGGDPNAEWPRNQRPLFIAVRRDRPELVEVLIRYGASLDAVDEKGEWNGRIQVASARRSASAKAS